MSRGPNAGPSSGGTEFRAREVERLRLLRAVAAGDQDALAALYDDASRHVFGLAMRVLSDPSAAEDVTLEVFVQVWKTAASFDVKRGSPTAWLSTIARSRAIDRLRAGGQERRRAEPLERAEAVVASAAGSDPERGAVDAERRALVASALSELPAEQRQVVELAYFRGLSHTEIAAELTQPLGTVKTRIRLAMNRLRESLSDLRG